MNGAEFVLAAVRAQGVEYVFMDPGALNDAFMAPMTSTPGLDTVVAAFEGGAAYMADGYARASGKLGVCFGIGGPGVLNMTTALAAAGADRSQVLVVSGEVPRSWEGIGGFQDASGAAVDDVGVLKPVTGLSISVSAPSVLPHHLRHAMTHAYTQRRPAHLSIPVDVQKAPVDAEWKPVPAELSHPHFLDEAAFDRLLAVLDGPSAPRNVVFLAGPGVAHAGGCDLLRSVAERFDVPVATTLSGKGLLPEDHPLALGVFGYGGTSWAIHALRDPAVEVLVVVGSGLSQRDTMQWDPAMLPSQALVHVETDPLLIGRTWPSDVPLLGDAATFLGRLADLGPEAARGLEAGREERRRFVRRVKEGGSRVYQEEDTLSDARPMHPARVVAELRRAFPRDGALCVDSGAHRAWFAEYWTVHAPGSHFSLTNLGPMGGALPLAVGAWLARPERPMMVATGDGCMLMHGLELPLGRPAGRAPGGGAHGQPRLRQHLVPRPPAGAGARGPDRDRRRQLGAPSPGRWAPAPRRSTIPARSARRWAGRSPPAGPTCWTCGWTSGTPRRWRRGAERQAEWEDHE